MGHWEPSTDDEFTPAVENAADGVFKAMREFHAGQSEVSGYGADEDRKMFSVVVAEGPGAVVAIHVDWDEQTVVTAWRTP